MGGGGAKTFRVSCHARYFVCEKSVSRVSVSVVVLSVSPEGRSAVIGRETTPPPRHHLRPALGSFVHAAGRLSDVSVFVWRPQNTVTATVAAAVCCFYWSVLDFSFQEGKKTMRMRTHEEGADG